MLGQNTTHANFSVDDLAAAKKFYVDTLGFTIAKEDKDSLFIESGAGTYANIYYKPDHQAWDATVFGIEVSDVLAAVDELKAVGVTVEMLEGTDENGIMSDPESGDAAWFKDPAGNWICVSNLML